MSQQIKAKTAFLLQEASRVRKILEEFNLDPAQLVLPDLRRSLLSDIDALEQNLMNEVKGRSRTIDSLLDFEEGEVWIRGTKPKKSSQPSFDATKVDKELGDEIIRRVSTEETVYLRPDVFVKRLTELKKGVSDGKYDADLYTHHSLLIFRMMSA